MIKLPDRQVLLDAFDYNPETGVVTHKQPGKRYGKPAGSRGRRHYQIRFKGKLYMLHRIIWLMQTGEDLAESGLEVDHINKNGHDNRWSNLRTATRSENNRNTRGWGITWDKRLNKWRAFIKVNKKLIYIGSSVCPLLARIMYEDKKRELHGEFAGV